VVAQMPAFDEEILSRIRSGRVSGAEVAFRPQEIGRYQILVTGLVDGKTKILGTADLDVGEAPTATPTASVPTPTIGAPTATATTAPGIGEDDGCAIAGAPGRSSNGLLVLLLYPALFVMLRSRRWRDRRAGRNFPKHRGGDR
jgi:hypothetical protein